MSSTASPSRIFMLLAAIVLLLNTATGNEIYENRGIKSANGDKRPFFVGSRYGRSQSDLTNMDENGKPMSRIVPRNDRFFFGSRYGKRSLPVTALDDDTAFDSKNQGMNCFYTGVANLFRCVHD